VGFGGDARLRAEGEARQGKAGQGGARQGKATRLVFDQRRAGQRSLARLPHIDFRVSTSRYGASMPRRLISSGSSFERDIGYSRAVVFGSHVFVSGTTGFDYTTMTISDDVATQTEQCLRNIEAALREAGASMRDVVRVRYILPNAADFPATWPALRAAFGDIRPAATMIEAGLADPRMKIEIEVDAIIGSA
jgi:enamine deaminase RidA (YjgF/YER057c/UK114 family)